MGAEWGQAGDGGGSMKERPILFSAPMIRAILAGTKTQTRRVVKPTFATDAIPCEMGATNEHGHQISGHSGMWWCDAEGNHEKAVRCPYGKPGDQLWVREAWQYYDWTDDGEPCIRYAADNATAWPTSTEAWGEKLQDVWAALSMNENYAIDMAARDRRWRPSIHMPRWASRITLEVTAVKVERLQDISEADAKAEGAEPYRLPVHPDREHLRHVDGYHALWESINGPGSWDANPWVWCVSFKRLEAA